ncbi:MAG TPA: DUF881 domain-containing protein [Mycobacteriales bacterium]|nr:DUF881 domain-containing protein [Mycobacteriales bacterium]
MSRSPVSDQPSSAEVPPRRLDGSMSLLVDVMTNTLDEAYAARAAQKRGTGGGSSAPAPRGARPGRLPGVLVLVLLGLLTGTAVAHVRDRAQAAEGLRSDLAEEVRGRSAETDRLEAAAAALRSEVAATRDIALEADAAGSRVGERLRALELASATVPVRGPGVVLTIADAEQDPTLGTDVRLRGGSPLDGRVLDRDLQVVVNGLWAAGAEAVTINGVRLSSRAAIRSAGEAVLVDFRPLSPPYRLEAIGRPASLEVDFVDSQAGRFLESLSSFSGITWTLDRSERLTMPAATEPQLRAARPEEPS